MSFAAQTRERTGPSVPLAALVDIMFLLLVFFMTASAFRETDRQIPVRLPASESEQTGVMTRAPVVVTIQHDGTIFMGDRPYELNDLRTVLNRLGEDYPEERVLIRSDERSQVGVTVQVLDAAYSAGLQDAALDTSKPLPGE